MFKLLLLIMILVKFSKASPCTSTENPAYLTATAPNWDELISSLNILKDNSKTNRDNFNSLINLLKNVLLNEFENCTAIVKYENNQEIIEEKAEFITDSDSENSTEQLTENADKDFDYQSVLDRVSLALERSKANKLDALMETPNMIPIFKPKHRKPQDKSADTSAVPTSSVLKEDQQKKPHPVFTIPCQRTSDILDGSLLIPSEYRSPVAVNSNEERNNVENKVSPPKVVSVVETDENISILFKPKTITLKQVYGNLLKKITITVLVPYHISKLNL